MSRDDLTSEARAEIDALVKKPEEEIRLDDIPEVADWSGAERGRFYRPVKKSISIRLDADVIAWFKSSGGKYQSRINEVLRQHMKEHVSARR